MITNDQIMTAASAAIESLKAQGCHIYGNLADAIYSSLWEAVNELAPRWEEELAELND